ncbi:MAG TPA: hypothetical protein VGD40_19785 [Chryseosolibacter sp.]
MQRAIKKSLNHINKAIALVLVLVYVLFSVGVIKATHFCMGREASVQFFTAETKKCLCSQYVEEKNSCCDDEHELIRLDDEQKTISGISAPLPIWKVERIFTERLLTLTIVSQPADAINESAKAPPKVPIWKANRCYVFYNDGSDSDLLS